MKIFFKTNLNLDELAASFREILNIPPTNRSQIIQARDGLNIGSGLYYYFEVFGLKLYLIQNSGEVAYPEKAEFQFYTYLENHEGLDENLDAITNYVAQVFNEEGFEIQIAEVGE
jgi:hypothetical protein